MNKEVFARVELGEPVRTRKFTHELKKEESPTKTTISLTWESENPEDHEYVTNHYMPILADLQSLLDIKCRRVKMEPVQHK